MEVGIGPHVDHDVQDADFNETRLPSQKYYDQYTGLELDPVGAAAARQSEIDFAWKLKAFEPRPQTEAYQRMGRKPFGMRWIDCDKGDEQRPELRSRLVVQETRQTGTISVSDIAAVTSSTPPLEVVRLVCSLLFFAASSTQTILSLSSGEEEFYGAVRCACRALGLKSLMSDLSLEVKAELVTDSSACKKLCSRRGAGKIRHIHCPALWLQHAVARRQVAITRRAGKDLAPDVGTKAGIPEDTMCRLLGMFGLAKREDRAKQALNMAGRQAEA